MTPSIFLYIGLTNLFKKKLSSGAGFRAILLLLTGLAACEPKLPQDVELAIAKLPQQLDYNIHVKPILSDRCFACHGPDKNKQKGDLRLDIKKVAYEKEAEESGRKALVPGNLAKSEVFHRIISTDPEFMMPTPESHLKLTAAEKAILVKWIKDGAEYKPHWSLVVAKKPKLPQVKNKSWAKNSIDRFILAKLEEKSLQPNAEASKETLIRRVSFDLTGLPPTLEEVDAFLADKTPQAYERMVNRKLQSPHFGERLAVDWLDVARYADTHGYQDDGLRNAYPWRDWVISAFNRNIPYDKFITWQLAGDLIPNATKEQLIATCFLRNHPQSQEGGIVDEEYRVEYVADRVNTFGKAFLAISTECARCHDHKYDPISQKNYFQLYAFFNSNNEAGEVPYAGEASPALMLTTPEAEKMISFIKSRTEPLARQEANLNTYQEDFTRWLNQDHSNANTLNLSDRGLIAHLPLDDDKTENTVKTLFEIKNPAPDKPKKKNGKPANAQVKGKPNVKAGAKPANGNVKKAGARKPGKGKKASPKKPGQNPGSENIIANQNPGKKAPANKKKENQRKMAALKAKEAKAQENKVPAIARLQIAAEGNKPTVVTGKYGNALRMEGDMGIGFNQLLDFDRNEPFSISIWVKTFNATEAGPLFARPGGDLNGWRGYWCELNKDQTLAIKLTHVYPANMINLQTKQKLVPNRWHHLVMTYDGSSQAQGVRFYINGSPAPAMVIHDNLTKSILHAKGRTNNGGSSSFRIGREFRASISNVAFDEFRGYNRRLSLLEVQQLAGQANLLSQLLKTPVSRLKPSEKEMLLEYYVLAIDKKHETIEKQLIAVRGKENDIMTEQEEVMIYEELPKPRTSFILDRGAYDAPTKRVYPGTPESIMPFDKSLPKNRWGLAQWLVSEKQPLFNRVVVNRFWQQCFGQGLVKTSEDFGNQGNLPTHPELLDYLAVTFRENNWNVKALLKMMVMSATYRQSSIPTKQHLKHDPNNIFLARAPSYRLSAEMIRDNALVASNLLSRKVGGKSVSPYQPEGVWEALAVRNAVRYEQGHGEDLYRRSLYTIWKRSSPHPAMINFDVPDRYACSIRRQNTSTPLQALVLMNDVQFVEAARVLGERMVEKGGNTPEQRITYAFRALTSRYPRADELNILSNLYKAEQADFVKSPERAEKLVGEGEYPRNQALNITDVATCAVIANALMSFDEFVTKR